MKRRTADTLIEVLMAIFIMGIGSDGAAVAVPVGGCAGGAGAQGPSAPPSARALPARSSAPSGSRRARPTPNRRASFWDSFTRTPRSPQRFIMALDDPNLDDSTLVPPLVNSAAEGPNLNKPNPQLPDYGPPAGHRPGGRGVELPGVLRPDRLAATLGEPVPALVAARAAATDQQREQARGHSAPPALREGSGPLRTLGSSWGRAGRPVALSRTFSGF